MNSFDGFIIVFSGILLVSLLVVFVRDLLIVSLNSSDSLDLSNVINIYNRGRVLNASFSVLYKPLNPGVLNVTLERVYLGNSSIVNPGFPVTYCVYDSLVINEGSVACA